MNDTSDFDAIFVGYSSNPAVALLLKPSDTSNRILRGHHVIIDPYGISSSPSIDKLQPNEVLFQ